jgi:hypothetical protein
VIPHSMAVHERTIESNNFILAPEVIEFQCHVLSGSYEYISSVLSTLLPYEAKSCQILKCVHGVVCQVFVSMPLHQFGSSSGHETDAMRQRVFTAA